MAQKTSKSNENYFSRYKQNGLYAKNRKRKLAKQLRLQPNNSKQVEEAIAVLTSYRRKTPLNPKWNPAAIAEVMIQKEFAKANKEVPVTKYRSLFSIGARAHNKGQPVW